VVIAGNGNGAFVSVSGGVQLLGNCFRARRTVDGQNSGSEGRMKEEVQKMREEHEGRDD
jgi:hypothetical protein